MTIDIQLTDWVIDGCGNALEVVRVTDREITLGDIRSKVPELRLRRDQLEWMLENSYSLDTEERRAQK